MQPLVDSRIGHRLNRAEVKWFGTSVLLALMGGAVITYLLIYLDPSVYTE